jgi:hypothetical protein
MRRLAPILFIALAGCGGGDRAPDPALAEQAPRRIVDSIFPIEEEIRRFQVGLQPVTAFSGGAASRDALVERFLTALERADTSAFAPLALSTAEFGYLYFPESRFTRPPYKTKPGLVWFQIQNGSSRGLSRALERLGGRPLGVRSYQCGAPADTVGRSRVWEGCVVTFRPPEAEGARTMRLFGGIIEREGIYKFIGYANDF